MCRASTIVFRGPLASPIAGSGQAARSPTLMPSTVDSVPSDVRREFEKAFDAWNETWFRGGLAISSVPHTRAIGNEFDALVALGPQILPLVVEKLTDPDNFLALTLYDAIQPDGKLV